MSQDPLEVSLSGDLTVDTTSVSLGMDAFTTTAAGPVFESSSPLSRVAAAAATNVPRPPSGPQSPQQFGRRTIPLTNTLSQDSSSEANANDAATSSSSSGQLGGGGSSSAPQGPLVFRSGSNVSTPKRPGVPVSPTPPAVLGGVAAAAAISAGCPTKTSTNLGPRPPPTPPQGGHQHRSGPRLRGCTNRCASPIAPLPPCTVDAEMAVAVVDMTGAIGVGGVGRGGGGARGGPLDAGGRTCHSAGSSGSLDGCGLAARTGSSSGNGEGAVSGSSCASRGLTTPTTLCMSACAGVSGRTTTTIHCVGAAYPSAHTKPSHPAGCAGATTASVAAAPGQRVKDLGVLSDVTSSPGEQTPGGTGVQRGHGGFNPCADPRLAALRAPCPTLVLGPCPSSGAAALAAKYATLALKVCPKAQQQQQGSSSSSMHSPPAAMTCQQQQQAAATQCTAEAEARWYRNCLPKDLHCFSDAPSESDLDECPLSKFRPNIRAAAAAAAAGATASGADRTTATSIALAAAEAAANFHRRQMSGLPPEEMKPGNCPELIKKAWQLQSELQQTVQGGAAGVCASAIASAPDCPQLQQLMSLDPTESGAVACQLQRQLQQFKESGVCCPKTAAAAAWTLPPIPKEVMAQMTPEGTEKMSEECKRKISECARKRREQMLKFRIEHAEQVEKLQANGGRPLPPPAATCPMATTTTSTGISRPPLAPQQRQHLGTDDDDGAALHARPRSAGVPRGAALSSTAKPWIPPCAPAASPGRIHDSATPPMAVIVGGAPTGHALQHPQQQQAPCTAIAGGWTVSCGKASSSATSAEHSNPAAHVLPSVFPSIRVGAAASCMSPIVTVAAAPAAAAPPPGGTGSCGSGGAPSVTVGPLGGAAGAPMGPGGAFGAGGVMPSLDALSALYGPSATMAVKQACLAKAAAMSGLATVPAAGTPEAYFLMGQITAFAAIRQQQQLATAAAAMAVAGGSSSCSGTTAPPPPPQYHQACGIAVGVPFGAQQLPLPPPPVPGYFTQMGHPLAAGPYTHPPSHAHAYGRGPYHQPPHTAPVPPYDVAAAAASVVGKKKATGSSSACTGSPPASLYAFGAGHGGGGEASTTASVGSCTPRIPTVRGSTTSSIAGSSVTARHTPVGAGHAVIVRASSASGVSAGSGGGDVIFASSCVGGGGVSISDMSCATLLPSSELPSGIHEVLTAALSDEPPKASATMDETTEAAATAATGTGGKKRRKRGGGGGGGGGGGAPTAATGADQPPAGDKDADAAATVTGEGTAASAAVADGDAVDRSATKPTPFAVPEGTVFFDAIPVLAYNLTNAPLPEGYALPPDSSGDGRYKQLCHGFTSAEYAKYRRLVPRHERQVGNSSHPLTPRAEFSMTRRAFRDLVFQWRQDLHRWDTIASAQEAHAEGLPTMLEAGWEPVEQPNEGALRALIRDAHRTLGHSEDEIRQLGLLDEEADDKDSGAAAAPAAKTTADA